MTENSGRLQIELLFGALSDRHRRQLVAYMHTINKDLFHLDDLAQIIAIQETDPSEVSEEKREQVKIELHHRHLPKLDDAGLIEYDSRNGDVRYRGTTDSELIDVSQFLNSTEEIAANIDQ
ncbi:DUF7344 domain-containing protein [Natronosalvus halobius]|uniref:DUF7344 domain-containing protein n=1 Tax=Natronosalvus halobius TaxID=2953746 RepID=UPI00209C857E|nr:hypothetical protein [Natronosalvus halobius]USZ70428.1 hypothetical protein NGM15_09890 [Natronosalvus halobius]